MMKNMDLIFMIGLWYGSSGVCTNTAKQLQMEGWSSPHLTLAQLGISTICSYVALIVLKLRPYKVVGNSYEERRLTCLLALSFVLGFITLNSAFAMMHVSLVMVVRATEPLFTMGAASIFLENEITNCRVFIATLPIVVGAGISALESGDATLVGMVVVLSCNICFAARGVSTKLLKEKYQPDDFSLFFNICAIGTLIQLFYIGSAGIISTFIGTSQSKENLPLQLSLTSFINGFTFWMYLQLSWLVLGRVSAVSHSVLNSLRRPVICAFGFIRFGDNPTVMNIVGIIMASGGALWYGHVKRTETEKIVSKVRAGAVGGSAGSRGDV